MEVALDSMLTPAGTTRPESADHKHFQRRGDFDDIKFSLLRVFIDIESMHETGKSRSIPKRRFNDIEFCLNMSVDVINKTGNCRIN